MSAPLGLFRLTRVLVTLLATAILPSSGSAQAPQNQGLVERDDSLAGVPAGIVGPGIDTLGQHADYLVAPDLGEQRDGILVFSFERFGIGTGEVLTLTGPDPSVLPDPGVETIILRVTGRASSSLDGTLRSTLPGVDVYLLNPAGLAFASESRLDVGGSFHATTADRLELPDGEVLDTHLDGGPASLPELARLEEFVFFGASRSEIVVADGSTLEVPTTGSLSLIGAGPVTTSGELVTSRLEGSGRVTIRGSSVSMVKGLISAGHKYKSGGEIDIEGTRDVTIAGVVQDRPRNYETRGPGGRVRIRGETLHLEPSGSIHAESRDGDGGEIDLEATGDVTIAGEVSAFSELGHPGHVSIRGGTVEVEGVVNSQGEEGYGDGRIGIESDHVRITGVLRVDAEGGSGSVVIRARTVALEASGTINADFEYGDGDGGQIEIFADKFSMQGDPNDRQGTLISASGGRISITASRVFVGSHSTISTIHRSYEGGRIEIHGSRVTLQYATISSDSQNSRAPRDAGDVLIDARRSVKLLGSIVSAASRHGNGGNVTIVSGRAVRLSHSTITADARYGGAQAGRIRINPRSLEGDPERDIDPARIVALRGSAIVAKSEEGMGGFIAVRAHRFTQDVSEVEATRNGYSVRVKCGELHIVMDRFRLREVPPEARWCVGHALAGDGER